jgi:hypothetical protein
MRASTANGVPASAAAKALLLHSGLERRRHAFARFIVIARFHRGFAGGGRNVLSEFRQLPELRQRREIAS